MSPIDWSILAAYVLLALGIGLAFRKWASRSTADFFVAGRSLPWFVAGTSMVATTFSADTPLFVAGLARESGIHANWFWWSGAIGTLAGVFFFARLWRRSGVSTDLELISLRYDPGRASTALRVFRALHDGVFLNCIIMGSVTFAMSKVIVAVLGLSDAPISVLGLGTITPVAAVLIGLGLAALLYTWLSGLYGVVYTDLLQFVLAMIGSIALAVIAYVDLESRGGFVEAVRASPSLAPDTLRMFPHFGVNRETLTFLVYVLVLWWPAAVGSGYFVQRTLATRGERDAVLGLGWFAFCHYVLRSWPWIVVGLASLVYFPGLGHAESAYPAMVDELLPTGLKGIMVASLLAAFMSTLDTHLNWGASYLINDVYKPLRKKDRTEAHDVGAARLSMLALVSFAFFIAMSLTTILGAYQYLAVIAAGSVAVQIARWYWWRINVWTEIAALLAGALFGNCLYFWWLPSSPDTDNFALQVLSNTLLAGTAALAVTWLTGRRHPTAQVIAFYHKLRVEGAGWARVRELTGLLPVDHRVSVSGALWLCSMLMLFGVMLAVGYALLQRTGAALLCLAMCLAGALLAHLARRRQPHPAGQRGSEPRP